MLSSLISLGRELGRGVLQLLYPTACLVCDRFLDPAPVPFCPTCLSALFTDRLPSCPRCAATVGPFVPLEDGCSHRRGDAFHFERAIRLGPYEELLRDVVLR